MGCKGKLRKLGCEGELSTEHIGEESTRSRRLETQKYCMSIVDDEVIHLQIEEKAAKLQVLRVQTIPEMQQGPM